MSDKHPSVEEILDNFVIWHWKQFQTGKYKKLADVPYSGSEQDEAIAAINALRRADQLALLDRLETSLRSQYDGGVPADSWYVTEFVKAERTRLNGTGKGEASNE